MPLFQSTFESDTLDSAPSQFRFSASNNFLVKTASVVGAKAMQLMTLGTFQTATPGASADVVVSVAGEIQASDYFKVGSGSLNGYETHLELLDSGEAHYIECIVGYSGADFPGLTVHRTGSSDIVIGDGTTFAQGDTYKRTTTLSGGTYTVEIYDATNATYLTSGGSWSATAQNAVSTAYSNLLDRALINDQGKSGNVANFWHDDVTVDDAPSASLDGGTIAAGTTTATTQALTSSVAASGGTGTITYQWQRKLGAGSYADVSGATSATLTDTGLTPGATYTWKRVATDDNGSADSNEITETMDSALTAGTITPGSPAASTCTLTCSAATHGTPSYTYQWYRDTTSGFTPGVGTILSGETSLTLNDSGLSPSTAYYYKVVATDATTTATTSEATITTTALQTVMQIDATSGWTVYARVTDQYGQYANGTTLEAYSSSNLSGYAISCTEDGTTGHYQGTFPALAEGIYSATFFHQAGGSPAQSDAAIGAGNLNWDGTKEVSVLPSEASGISVASIWNYLLTSITTAGSIGKVIKDYLDAAISSRLAPTTSGRTLDVSATGEAGLDFDNVKDATAAHTLANITVPTVTTLTGHTAQTGDAYARLGAPAGASVSADVAAVKTDTASLLARIGAWAGTGVNTLLGAFKALLSKTATLPTDIGGTFDPASDSTEAIRDRGDAAWGTSGGFDPATDTVDGITYDQVLQAILAATSGVATVTDNGDDTFTVAYKKRNGTTTKLSVTFDADGNRTDSTIS